MHDNVFGENQIKKVMRQQLIEFLISYRQRKNVDEQHLRIIKEEKTNFSIPFRLSMISVVDSMQSWHGHDEEKLKTTLITFFLFA